MLIFSRGVSIQYHEIIGLILSRVTSFIKSLESYVLSHTTLHVLKNVPFYKGVLIFNPM